MKRLLSVAVLLLSLGVAPCVFADAITGVVSSTTNAKWTRVVFNDSGSSIVSGEIVIWDNGDTEWERSGYPYVTTTTSTDSPWVAGVVDDGLDCPDQSLCSIVVQGPTIVKAADASDAFVDGNLVSTSSVDGQAGDWGNGDDTCFLGQAMELRDVDNATDTGRDGSRMWVNVNIGCN